MTRLIQRIIIHCSGTKLEQLCNAEIIDKWHKEKGYKCIGYHYVILPDGTVEIGRKEQEKGAHCQGYNSDSIGICYIGGLDKNGRPADTRTIEQKIELINIIQDLCSRYKIKSIAGHNFYNKNKACPCFNAKEEYKNYINDEEN